MSEQVVEGTPEEEVEETDEHSEDDQEQEDQPADDAAKLKKALERERRAKKKAMSDLAELRKQAQQGDPNKGEMEKLADQVKQLDQKLQSTSAVASLLEAGFNGSRMQAEKMIRLVDDFSDDEWVEELKVDFPERFGRRSRQSDGSRPSTGHGRDESRGTAKTPDERFAERLLGSTRRR